MKYSKVALYAFIGLSAIAVVDSVCVPDRNELSTAISPITDAGDGYHYIGTNGDWGPIENWCFADDDSLKNFSNLFAAKSSFNADISGWNVSKVTSMREMFDGATAFNQNIGGWNVSSVTDMYEMFYAAAAFNQNIGGWDVSKVENMNAMFRSASAFNQNIGGWDVSSVTDMGFMFAVATAFNQNIGGWDVSSVTNMTRMFFNASAFNQDLCPWGPKISDENGIITTTVLIMFGGSDCHNIVPVDGTDGGLPQNLCTNTECVPTTNSGGDPHFIGFNQKLITYQGECTLILLESPAATATGEDVTVHVRTTRKLDFSCISGVAMKIGEDVIEIKPNADIVLNDVAITMVDEPLTQSGLSFAFTKEEKGTKKMIVSYSFDIGNGHIIDVQANKKRGMMFVRTKGVFPVETVGLLGSPGKSEMVSRDGNVLMTWDEIAVKAYGETWQVKDTDLQLFQQPLGPQYPQKCLYEDASGATAQVRGRRKLMAKKVVTVEEAERACTTVVGMKNALCVQDTIAMGELDVKDDPFYLE